MVDRFDSWLDALNRRCLADLRPSEVNRAVRALSDDYVHRRHRVASEALSGRGKRAAFALFFGPLHFLVVRDIIRGLGLSGARFQQIVDLGCGTGAAGAAAGSEVAHPARVLGIDRQGWTLEEAAFTYRHFGLRHRVLRADLRSPRFRLPSGALVVAAYTVNELDTDARELMREWLCSALEPTCALLIVEPIAKAVTPWWGRWSAALRRLGAREREWRFTEPLPQRLRQMDKAAGLDHQERKARTLWIGSRG